MIMYSTAPSSAPQNVMVTTLDKASLNVTWDPPLAIDQNGPLTSYFITYETAGENLMSVTVDATQHMYILSSLTPYVNYSVQVAATNVNGTGIFSSTVMNISGQSGKYTEFIWESSAEDKIHGV